MYQHRPGSVRSLSLLICAEMKKDAQKAYYGNILCSILNSLTHGKFPSWTDVFGDKRERHEETAEEITNHILQKLGVTNYA